MKVLVLGASGIIGQHLRLCVPDGVEPVWVRRIADAITRGCDLTSPRHLVQLLRETQADVIVNLAGESSPDVVERDHAKYEAINVGLPAALADWCRHNGKRLIQISSQAVFSGDEPPYSATDKDFPVNLYGQQKVGAEEAVLAASQQVIRLTFVLGIRPLPHVGRQNPLEAMLEGQSPQVDNRWFSPLMAWDAAEQIWREVVEPSGEPLIQCGIPERWSRYEIAKLVNPNVQACKHEDFADIAPRPVNTTYVGSRWKYPLVCSMAPNVINIGVALRDAGYKDRAIELALFFGIRLECARTKISQGFGPLHNAVSDEWRKRKPKTESEMLDFYRTTEAYIWELSAYHEDAGFNYAGMCGGIATRLKGEPDCGRVLCLGDGIGDLTLTLHRSGFDARYHDLIGSRTAEYAAFRFWRQTGLQIPYYDALVPDPQWDAVVSLDFLEHVPDVECWVCGIHAALRPGGLFCSQNAFNCGSGPDGAIPMHLACNDHWEKDWDPLLKEVGFEQLASNWYKKK